MCTKKNGDSTSPLFKIGCFLCYQKKVGNIAVTYFIGNIVYFALLMHFLKDTQRFWRGGLLCSKILASKLNGTLELAAAIFGK